MKRRVAASVRPVNKNTSVVGMNSTCESRSSLKLIQVSKKKNPRAAVFLMCLICCPLLRKNNQRRTGCGEKRGKEGAERSYCSLILFSCLIISMRNEQLPERIFGRGQRGKSPVCPPGAGHWVLPTPWTQGSAPAPSEHISTIPHLTKHIRHCFVSDDANGIINGDFSQLTAWCERGEWLYYSPVLCSDFLWLYYIGPYIIPYE